MKFIPIQELDTKMIRYPKRDFERNVKSLLHQMSAAQIANVNQYAVTLLNIIFEQGITMVDIEAFIYTIKGKTLAMNRMATGERVFVVALMAHYAKVAIALSYDIWELTKKTRNLFMMTFKESPYIILTEEQKSVTRALMLQRELACLKEEQND